MRAVRFAAAEAARTRLGIELSAAEQAENQPFITEARQTVGDHAFAREWALGSALTLEEAVAYALESVQSNDPGSRVTQ